MDTNKIRQIISELESEIKLKSSAISVLKALLASEEGVSRNPSLPLTLIDNDSTGKSSESYMDLAVKAVGEKSAPMHINAIVDYIRRVKNNPNIERRSIEATVSQHVKNKGEKSRLIKVGRGMYAPRRYPRTELTA